MRHPESINKASLRRGWSHTALRFGGTLTYKRLKQTTYDPEEGKVKEYWEEASTKYVRGQARQHELLASGGVIQSDDIWVLIPRDIFSKQEEEVDRPFPGVGDEVDIDGEEWVASLGGTLLWEFDPSETFFKIWLRRKTH